jgi:hypothetical protein
MEDAMVVRDVNLLRSLLALKGLHKQTDIAAALDMSKNSIVRMFKQKPVLLATARRVAKLAVIELEEEPTPGQGER